MIGIAWVSGCLACKAPPRGGRPAHGEVRVSREEVDAMRQEIRELHTVMDRLHVRLVELEVAVTSMDERVEGLEIQGVASRVHPETQSRASGWDDAIRTAVALLRCAKEAEAANGNQKAMLALHHAAHMIERLAVSSVTGDR
ncbi:hypothetical protein [Deferrisoma camini]|uniref:hypothetical protein n=1 Tax=Deferrisoma camini TaxID=1035120 RepID=UPI00046CBB7E|nr:hypothetical protein [Deferrisoma camini]